MRHFVVRFLMNAQMSCLKYFFKNNFFSLSNQQKLDSAFKSSTDSYLGKKKSFRLKIVVSSRSARMINSNFLDTNTAVSKWKECGDLFSRCERKSSVFSLLTLKSVLSLQEREANTKLYNHEWEKTRKKKVFKSLRRNECGPQMFAFEVLRFQSSVRQKKLSSLQSSIWQMLSSGHKFLDFYLCAHACVAKVEIKKTSCFLSSLRRYFWIFKFSLLHLSISFLLPPLWIAF